MRFDDRKLKLKGKGGKDNRFNGKEIEVPISVPQYESHDEAVQQLGGNTETILEIVNDFLANRAAGTLRSKAAAYMKTNAETHDWPQVEKYILEQAPLVKGYEYTERGPSRKKQHEILDSLNKDAVASMSEEELRAMFAKLGGFSL